ncbi:hypothetical protein M3Y97_00493600 [Aphelenchoides bicaudatus]|nr:hypothetical protein M3Y97_00493600 [Aphelenchoides bicaudatus]
MGLVFYQLGYIMWFMVAHKGGTNPERSLVMFNWLLQSFISMCFIIYWQRNGHFNQLALVVPWKNVALSGDNVFAARVCKAFLVFWAIFFTCLFTLLLSVLFEFLIPNYTHYDPLLLSSYGPSQLRFISYGVAFYSFLVWNTAMALYVVVSLTVHQELEMFNESLREIGEDKSREEVSEQLLERYVKHVELANMIRIVDNTFEVYTFMMLGTNVPTTVFTLLSFYYAWGQNYYDVILSVPELLFCIVQITGLTLQPARVFSSIRQVETIIYGNHNIWMPFNDKVYQIARIFISHANQGSLGITIWGFTVVTKPLILTMFSLTLTYLTLLIQMNTGTPATNSTNATMIH